jgi:predicted nuclease with TOPRIM domain
MTQSTEQEIIKKLDRLSSNVDDVKSTLTNIDKRLAVLEGRFESQQKAIDKIPDLAEKVGELKNWRQIAIIIITGTASTVFGWFLKSGRY